MKEPLEFSISKIVFGFKEKEVLHYRKKNFLPRNNKQKGQSSTGTLPISQLTKQRF